MIATKEFLEKEILILNDESCKNKGEKICDLYGDMLIEEFFNQTSIKINANPPELWSILTSW